MVAVLEPVSPSRCMSKSPNTRRRFVPSKLPVCAENVPCVAIWSAEATNPTLNEDFYLCTGLHKKVFADQTADSFEITAMTDFKIVGNTVFGSGLQEADATSDYDTITAQVDSARIDKS